MIANTPRSNALVLGTYAIVAIVLLSVAMWLAREPIQQTERAQLQDTLTVLLGTTRFDNAPEADYIIITSTEAAFMPEPSFVVYRVRLNGEPVAAVFNAVARDAYNGIIELMIGMRVDGVLTGVRVTSHRETPGLGDDIEANRSQWIHGFDQLQTLAMPGSNWEVKKYGGQFDQFTGATITPRAVVRAVHHASSWFMKSQHAIFNDKN